eukprot:CAMPEP_0175271800 /NCGR_PEP_ID=MMETSP0093-20121207/46098_1 /TAXON_ID=311494 /ORGANISM="Alexandrium monilatum, Strain CCMP3105" /LENGTH=153 /DNA_ID=CAMNT_0016566573 /DNA_START=82 /DNA_END=541 /DNA_ORIENTATION=-
MRPINAAQNSVGPSEKLMPEAASEACLQIVLRLEAGLAPDVLALAPRLQQLRELRLQSPAVLNSSSRVISPCLSSSSPEPPPVRDADLRARGCTPEASRPGWPTKAARGVANSRSVTDTETATAQHHMARCIRHLAAGCQGRAAHLASRGKPS